jgi:two-component system OmpR family sensor kinase
VPVPKADDELRDAVLAVNALLSRLEGGFARQRRFTADVSHELRTPLAVVASELEVGLRRPRTVAEWEQTATTALDEIRRLARLVEALLELGRAEASPAPDVVPLSSILDGVVARCERAAAQAAVELRVASPSSDIAVVGSVDQLVSAIGNVVLNGVRATPRGTRVDLRCGVHGECVVLDVDDQGPGVSKEDRERIFAPFVRGKVAGGEGFGLGLAIARRLVEHAGGTLAAGSAPSGGARFTFMLRVAQPIER